MNYKTAKKLKDAGFPQDLEIGFDRLGCQHGRHTEGKYYTSDLCIAVFIPTLSELIAVLPHMSFFMYNGASI